MKRIICLLLSAMLLALLLTSCAEQTDDPEKTTNAEASVAATDPPESEAVTNSLPPDLKYSGETVVFLSRDADFVRDEITVEQEDGGVISSAIIRRNDDVENRFGIKLQNTKVSGGQYVASDEVEKAVNTGEHLYDIIANSCYSTINYTGKGILYNLIGLEHLDLSAPYWSQGFNDVAYIGKGQYMCTGAASLALYRLMFVTFFNRELLESSGEESLFDVVNDGRWTLDYQIRLGKNIFADKDSSGGASEGDTVGLVSATLSYIDPYWSSCQNPILKKNDDNWFEYAVDIDRLSSTLEKVIDLFYDANSYIVTSGGDSERQNTVSKMFSEGHAATATLRLCASETEYLRDMTAKYGVIPMPKLDENQEDYQTFLHDQFTAFGICQPVDAERAEMLGAVLEYMAWSSYVNVVPVYYNVALKARYMQDSASWDMLDKIYANVYMDAGVLYTKVLNSVHQMPRNIVTSKINTTASKYKAVKPAVENSLRILQDSIKKLQDME